MKVGFGLLVMMFVSIALIAVVLISSCTLSFSNISTHGTATDVIDETLSTAPSTSVSVPLIK